MAHLGYNRMHSHSGSGSGSGSALRSCVAGTVKVPFGKATVTLPGFPSVGPTEEPTVPSGTSALELVQVNLVPFGNAFSAAATATAFARS